MDSITTKIQTTVEHYVRVGQLSLLSAVNRIRADQLDILIDLGLFTGKFEIMALKAAPIQVGKKGKVHFIYTNR